MEGGVAMEMEGIASLALLPSGSISGHFVHPSTSTCLAIFGTEIACERECSRGEDYRLINLTVHDFPTKREAHVIVECQGEDAARFSNAENVHGWQEDVIKAAERGKKREHTFFISFECDVLKSDKESEEHIRRFLPSLDGLGAVVNIGTMIIKGLDFDLRSREVDVEDMSQFSGRLLESTSEFSRSMISEVDHAESSSICRENVGTVRASPKPMLPFNTLRSFVFGEPGAFPLDGELHKLVKEELENEGLSSEEFSWEEDASGWRTKRRRGTRCLVSVDSSNPTDALTEDAL